MDLKKTGLALLLANCAEPSLHLDSISETVGQLHLQSEEKVKKLEEHLERVSLLTQEIQEKGRQSIRTTGSKSPSGPYEKRTVVVYSALFEDRTHYQWDVSYSDGGLFFDFSHRIEHDFFKLPRYGVDTTYEIVDTDSNGQEDSARMVIWKGEFAMSCDNINNGYPLCGDELLEDLDLNHLPPGCRITDVPTCSAQGTVYHLAKNPYTAAMYRSLVKTTLERLAGKNTDLDLEFIDAWEQIKINEKRLLKDCR